MAVMINQMTMALARQLPKNLEASLKKEHQEGILRQAMVLDQIETLPRCKGQCLGRTQESTNCDHLKILPLL